MGIGLRAAKVTRSETYALLRGEAWALPSLRDVAPLTGATITGRASAGRFLQRQMHNG